MSRQNFNMRGYQSARPVPHGHHMPPQGMNPPPQQPVHRQPPQGGMMGGRMTRSMHPSNHQPQTMRPNGGGMGRAPQPPMGMGRRPPSQPTNLPGRMHASPMGMGSPMQPRNMNNTMNTGRMPMPNPSRMGARQPQPLGRQPHPPMGVRQQQQLQHPQTSMGQHRQHMTQTQPMVQQQQRLAPPLTPVGPEQEPLKRIKRSSTVAWCPSMRPQHQGLIASGTNAGAIDANWNSKYYLEILSTSLAEPSASFRHIGSLEVTQSFSKIAWGRHGIADNTHPAGIIAGGFSDGSIGLYDPACIASKKESLLGKCSGHQTSVMGLDFHPTKHNLLASGSGDGEVLIWDLTNTKQPTVSKPHKDQKAHVMGVTAIAWNKSVPFILASSDESGVTNIWDLRYKRAILNMKSPGQYRLPVSGLAWHPTESVQIAVGYKGPIVEIWDLRKKGFPAVKIQGHGMHAGSVEAMDWCPHDSRGLMTSGDDRRTVCWDASTGEMLTEYNLGGPLSDINWHPTQPSLLATTSYEGQIDVHAIHDFGPHVPEWLKRPAGATFGFGGKLVSFSNSPEVPDAKKATAGPRMPGPVGIRSLVTEKEFVRNAKDLVEATMSNNPRGYCEMKAQRCVTNEEKETWRLMRALFEEGDTRVDLLLKELGFTPPKRQQSVGQQANMGGVGGHGGVQLQKQPSRESLMNEDDFWESMGDSKQPQTPQKADDSKDPKEAKVGASQANVEPPRDENATDANIRAALVVADYEKAAELCVESGRMADAVLIAQSGPDPSLWTRVVQKHFERHPLRWAKSTLFPLVTKDYAKMVASSSLSDWKETLAMLLAYTSKREDFPSLVDALALRLQTEADDNHAATLCYMTSGNIQNSATSWLRGQEKGNAGAGLQNTIEKLHFFSLARGLSGPPSMEIARKYCDFAELLASQGASADALTYLKRAIPRPDPNDANTLTLISRLEKALEGDPSLLDRQPEPQNIAPQPNNGLRGVQHRPAPPGGPSASPFRRGPVPGNSNLARGPMRPGPRPGGFQNNPPRGGMPGPSRNAPRGAMPAPRSGPMPGRPGARAGMPGPRPGPRPGPVPGPRPGAMPGPRPGAMPGPRPGAMPGRPGAMPGPRPGAMPGPRPGAMPQSRGMAAPMPGPRPGVMPTPMPGPRPGVMPTPMPGPRPGGMPAPRPGAMPAPRPSAMPAPRPGVPNPQPRAMARPPMGGQHHGMPAARGPMPAPRGNPMPAPRPGPMPGPRPGVMAPSRVPPQGGSHPPVMNNAPAPRGMGGRPTPPAPGPQPGPAPAPQQMGYNAPAAAPKPAMGGGMLRSMPPSQGGYNQNRVAPSSQPAPYNPAAHSAQPPAQQASASRPKGKVTGPRYSDIPSLSNRPNAQVASDAEQKNAANAVQQALGGAMNRLKGDGMLTNRDAKRLNDVEKRVDGLYQKLTSGQGLGGATPKLVTLCNALQNGDLAQAKSIHMSLCMEDSTGENLKWLTGVKQLLMLLQK